MDMGALLKTEYLEVSLHFKLNRLKGIFVLKKF